MDNDYLYKYTMEYVKKVQNHIINNKIEIPAYSYEEVIFSDNGGYSICESQITDYFELQGELWDYLKSMEEVKKIIELSITLNLMDIPIVINDKNEKIEPDYDSLFQKHIGKLMYLLEDYFNNLISDLFDEKLFTIIYTKHIELWKDRLKAIILIPIYGLYGEITDLNFSNNTVIERLTAKNKTFYWNMLNSSKGLSLDKFSNCNYILKTYYKKDSEIHSGMPKHLIEEINNIITSFRLAKKGMILYSEIIETDNYNKLVSIFYNNDSNINLVFGIVRGERYYLQTNDYSNIREIFIQLSDTNRIRDLLIGLRWFNHSYSCERNDDRIISLTICLESTILFNVRGELKFRLALLCSTLLKNNFNSSDTFNFLKKLYDTRSEIVHNGKSLNEISKNGNINNYNIEGFVNHSEEIVRATIVKYLNLIRSNKNLKQINEEMEKEIVCNLK